jgi:ABC-type uncharacterized transport system fused permease/ATPase subunit
MKFDFENLMDNLMELMLKILQFITIFFLFPMLLYLMGCIMLHIFGLDYMLPEFIKNGTSCSCHSHTVMPVIIR